MKKRLAFVFAGALCLSSILAFNARAAALDQPNSHISAEKSDLKADGIDNTRITVTLKDINLMPLEGTKVALSSSRGTQDQINAESDTTDSLGKAYFRVNSLKNGTSVYSAQAAGVTLVCPKARAQDIKKMVEKLRAAKSYDKVL